MKVIILCLLFLIPTAIAADKGIFYILDEKFIDNINELPFHPGIPSIEWQESKNLQAWIDIVGYRNLTREDGINYTFGDPANEAIIQYGTHSILSCNYASCSVDSIDSSITTSSSGNNTIARLHTVMKWTEIYCTNDGCQDHHYTEYADFYDYEDAPRVYPLLQNISVNVTQYNNSLYENIGIHIVNISGLNKYTIQYEDNIATYRQKKAHVEQTAKGVYFANVTPAEFLELKGKNISRYGEIILLNGNLSKMSHGDIKITGSNLYETRTANSSQFNITRLEFKPEKELENPVMMWFMSVMAVMVGGIYFYARRMTEW